MAATPVIITAVLAAMIALALLAWIAFGLGVALKKEWLIHAGGITAISLVVTLAGGLIWGSVQLFRLAATL